MELATLTDVELDEIRDRVNRASVGPWHTEPWNTLANGYLYGPAKIHWHKQPDTGLMKCFPPTSFRYEDAEFIAHARQDIPLLLAEIERLKNEMRSISQSTSVRPSS